VPPPAAPVSSAPKTTVTTTYAPPPQTMYPYPYPYPQSTPVISQPGYAGPYTPPGLLTGTVPITDATFM
jgi:hypothetical protein